MKLIALLAVVMTSSAFAEEYVSQKLNFTAGSNFGTSRQYYRCSWVEDQIESHLERLGATNIRVRCTGGLVYGTTPMPAYARATFDAPVVVPNGAVERVVLKGRNSCAFNSEFLDKAIPLFPAAKLVSKQVNCLNHRFAVWNYQVELSKI